MSKETFYFSHDYDCRSDMKIKKLIAKHGYLGYGLFWAIVEDLYMNANAMQTDYDLIAFDLRSDCNTIKSIINDFDLFVIEDGYFGSTSIQSRLEQRSEKSEKARKSAFARWNNEKKNANAMRPHNDGNAIKESKVKESKVNESKPTINDFKKYFQEKGYKEEVAEQAFNYYENLNWHDSKGTPIKNWKNKCVNVWFKPENKKPPKQKMYNYVINKVGHNKAVIKSREELFLQDCEMYGRENIQIVKEYEL